MKWSKIAETVGTGSTIESPCDDCHGRGHRVETKTIRFNVPPGAEHGTVELRGQGQLLNVVKDLGDLS